jgi:MFS family permease
MITVKNNEFHHSNVTTLKWVSRLSFLWSMSSLMVFSILPAFLVDELHMKHSQIGLIEGLAISSSFASKFFSGFLSDVFRQRKPLILVGTILNAFTKPMFALCSNSGWMFGIRFSDRLSKGIRSAPTDALIADLSASNLYASNFGIRQSLYTLGDVTGALCAMIIMVLSHGNYRLVFILSFIPAFLAVLVLCFLVRPNPKTHPRIDSKFQFKEIKIADLRDFSPAFWWLMVAFFFLMLARFSEAFLTLKAKDVGWTIALLPMLVIIKDLVHASVAWPAGQLADRLSRKQILAFGLLFMIAAQCILVFTSEIYGVFLGIIALGLHMGTTQGLLKALIAQFTPPELRGTAFSLFFMISGIAIFLGNTIAGNLSQLFGLNASFMGGAFFSAMSLVIIYFIFLRQSSKPLVQDA